MFYNGIQKPYNIERKDLQVFKYYTLIFALTRINFYFVETWTQIFGVILGSIFYGIINYGGILVFIYSFYRLSKRNPELPSSNRIFFLYILLLSIMLIRIELTLMFLNYPFLGLNFINAYYPIQISSLSPSIHIYNIVIQYLFIIYLVVLSLLTLDITNEFTDWFNDIFGRYNPTKVYYYFGVTFFAGTFIIVLSVIESSILVQSPVGYSIEVIGNIVLASSFILEIVALIKFYTRINDMVHKRTYVKNYPPNQLPYPNPYQKSFQNQSIYKNSIQLQNFNDDLVKNNLKGEAEQQSQMIKLQKNSRKKLPNASFLNKKLAIKVFGAIMIVLVIISVILVASGTFNINIVINIILIVILIIYFVLIVFLQLVLYKPLTILVVVGISTMLIIKIFNYLKNKKNKEKHLSIIYFNNKKKK